MKNLSTWLLIMFMVMFWIFRLIVAFTAEMGIDFGGIEPLNLHIEVVLLFVTLISFLFIVKRKIIGALIYLISYGMYFGVDLYNNVMIMLQSESGIGLETATNMMIGLIGMVIPIAILFDLLLDKNRKAHPVDKKTDWFYKNEQFDRKLDERADKNNYRTL